MKSLPLSVQKEMANYFEKEKISAEKQEKIIEAVKKLYIDSIYDPQEPVGVVAAQSLSEPATQMTMRTYHFAGTAGIQVTLGLPRMLEIFDARKEPRTPTMTIYLKKDFQDMEKVKRIATEIKEIKLKDIMISDVLDLTDLWIQCKINMEKAKALNIDVEKISKNIKMRNCTASLEKDMLTLTPRKSDVKNLRKMKYNLLETHVNGIKGINQVVVTKEEGEWVISTLGSNLKKVFEIEGVDFSRTTSNNILEIYDVLGIEAGRNAIIKQAQYTMEEQGLGVDIRYIMLLADLMTVDGLIRAIGRYGVAGQKASVLVRASFEETKKHLSAAAIKGESDNLKGTIENIMMNQVAPIGTGAYQLIGRIPGTKKQEKDRVEKGKKEKD
jgi:DNA-directed RNA polymerase subunit A"